MIKNSANKKLIKLRLKGQSQLERGADLLQPISSSKGIPISLKGIGKENVFSTYDGAGGKSSGDCPISPGARGMCTTDLMSMRSFLGLIPRDLNFLAVGQIRFSNEVTVAL